MANKKTHPLIEPFLMLNNLDGCFRVPLKNIVYCGSYNSSTVFHINNDKQIVVAKALGHYAKLLRVYGFIRINHNLLININYLCHNKKGDNSNQIILTTGETLTISRPKKNEVMDLLCAWCIEPELQVNPKKRQDSHKPNLEKLMLTF